MVVDEATSPRVLGLVASSTTVGVLGLVAMTTTLSRMAAFDCPRGLMLAIVLADYIDFMALNSGTIRFWTLLGLGFSGVSDVFVFLSGFVFGLEMRQRRKSAPAMAMVDLECN